MAPDSLSASGRQGLASYPKVTPVEAFERLKALIASAEEDVHKAEGGNKAAGTRARQIMQDIKNAAQDVRQAILGARGAEPPKDAKP